MRPNGTTWIYQATFEPGNSIRVTLSNFVYYTSGNPDPAIVTYDVNRNDQTPVIVETWEQNNELIVTWLNSTPPNRIRFNHFSHEIVLRKGGIPPQPIVELQVGFYKNIVGDP